MSSHELERVEVMGRVGVVGPEAERCSGDAGAELSPGEKTVAAESTGGQPRAN
jgi:hypothetical protein